MLVLQIAIGLYTQILVLINDTANTSLNIHVPLIFMIFMFG